GGGARRGLRSRPAARYHRAPARAARGGDRGPRTRYAGGDAGGGPGPPRAAPIGAGPAPRRGAGAGAAVNAAAALARLREGNRRFVASLREPAAAPGPAPHLPPAGAQRPFAIVLGCSDSRVP